MCWGFWIPRFWAWLKCDITGSRYQWETWTPRSGVDDWDVSCGSHFKRNWSINMYKPALTGDFPYIHIIYIYTYGYIIYIWIYIYMDIYIYGYIYIWIYLDRFVAIMCYTYLDTHPTTVRVFLHLFRPFGMTIDLGCFFSIGWWD